MFKAFCRTFAQVASTLDRLATLRNTRWALAIIMLGVALSPIRVMWADKSKAEANAEALKPIVSGDDLIEMRHRTVSEFQVIGNSPEDYFRTLDRRFFWEAASHRFLNHPVWQLSESEVHYRMQLGAMFMGMQGVTNASQQAYVQKFGADTMMETGKLHRASLPTPAWEKVDTKWSPNLGQKFFFAWVMIGFLSLLSTFLQFVEASNAAAFGRRVLWVAPLAFVAGPFTFRWAKPGESQLAGDLWFVTSFASAALTMAAPGAAVLVKAQAPTSGSKGKASVSRTSSGSENASEAGGDLAEALKRLGFNSIAVEALPATPNGKLRELSIEYTATTPLGRFGKVSWFGFGEARPGGEFTNHSASFMPKFFGAMSEQGWNGKKAFWDAGGKISLTAAPKVGKPLGNVFNFLSVAYTHGIITAPKHQVIVAWATKGWHVWSERLKISSEGFYRIRPGDVTNYGQPQILVQFGNCTKVKAVVQFDTPGRTVGVSAGAKFYFSLR